MSDKGIFALCGAGGVGKTTLATKIANEMGLVLLSESARVQAKLMGFQSTDEIRAAKEDVKLKFQSEVYFRQLRAEDRYRQYGAWSCRSLYDIVAYMTFYNLSSNICKQALKGANDHSKQYRVIFHCPLPDGMDEIEKDGFRLEDMGDALNYDEITRGILPGAQCPVVYLGGDRDGWIDEVKQWFEDERLAKEQAEKDIAEQAQMTRALWAQEKRQKKR